MSLIDDANNVLFRYPLMLGEIREADEKATNLLSDGENTEMVGVDIDNEDSVPTISILSPSGPIIHDVTHLMEGTDAEIFATEENSVLAETPPSNFEEE